MTRLTKAEEEVMRIIWKLGPCTVRQILDEIGRKKDKPPHSTISSIVRIIEEKGFLDHKAYGRTYEYFPVITKEAYSKFTLQKVTKDFFGGNVGNLVSFLVREEKISLDELTEMIKKLEDE